MSGIITGDGTGHAHFGEDHRTYAGLAERAAQRGTLTWKDLLKERAYAVLAQSDTEQLDSQLFALVKLAERWRADLASRQSG